MNPFGTTTVMVSITFLCTMWCSFYWTWWNLWTRCFSFPLPFWHRKKVQFVLWMVKYASGDFTSTLFAWRMWCSFECVEWKWKIDTFSISFTWVLATENLFDKFELDGFSPHADDSVWTYGRKEFVYMAFDKAMRSFNTTLHVRVLCMSFWMDQKLWKRTLRL